MFKKIFRFLFLGALIAGCSCDIHCFFDKQTHNLRLDISSIAQGNFDFCSSVEQSFNEVRRDAKNCSLTKINVDKFEAFTDQICFKNGTLRKVALKYQDCFGIQFGRALECLGEAGIQANIEQPEKPFELMKAICEKIDNIYSCINSKFRENCGVEAGKLTQNFTTALSTYTSGLCEEINGASLNQVVYMNILLGLLCLLLMWHKD